MEREIKKNFFCGGGRRSFFFYSRHLVCFCCLLQLCSPLISLSLHGYLKHYRNSKKKQHEKIFCGGQNPVSPTPQHRRLFLPCASVLLLDDGCSDSPQWLITNYVREGAGQLGSDVPKCCQAGRMLLKDFRDFCRKLTS